MAAQLGGGDGAADWDCDGAAEVDGALDSDGDGAAEVDGALDSDGELVTAAADSDGELITDAEGDLDGDAATLPLQPVSIENVVSPACVETAVNAMGLTAAASETASMMMVSEESPKASAMAFLRPSQSKSGQSSPSRHATSGALSHEVSLPR